jgi:hypothetical protein
MEMASNDGRTALLDSADHQAGVRLDFDDKAGNWLMTTYEKTESIARRLSPPTTLSSRAADDAQAGIVPARGDGADYRLCRRSAQS